MRSKCGLVNEIISDDHKMVTGISYFWYTQKNGDEVGQGFYVESDAKNKNHAKRKIRKIIQSRPDFSHWA